VEKDATWAAVMPSTVVKVPPAYTRVPFVARLYKVPLNRCRWKLGTGAPLRSSRAARLFAVTLLPVGLTRWVNWPPT
jgi:hypothetical protein